jgi:hypothetical protein
MKNSTAILIQVVLLAVIGLMLWKSDCVHAQSGSGFSFSNNGPFTPTAGLPAIANDNGTLTAFDAKGNKYILTLTPSTQDVKSWNGQTGNVTYVPSTVTCSKATMAKNVLTASGCTIH